MINIFSLSNYLTNNPILKEAFRKVCIEKLSLDNYCDMEEYIYSRIDKKETKRELSVNNSPLVYLYTNPYPKKEDVSNSWIKFMNTSKWNDYVFKNNLESSSYSKQYLSVIESKAIVNWMYQAYKTIDERQEITKELISSITEIYNIENLTCKDSIIYVEDKVDIHLVSSLSDFLELVPHVDRNGESFYFRGHSDANYILLPSIMRKSSWLIHEKDIYNKAIIECSDDFCNCSTHLEYLVKMQHYGVPTRLLDITKNPLIALYFACEDDFKKNGEVIRFIIGDNFIKYPGSDMVSILASLPMLNDTMKTKVYNWACDNNIDQQNFNKKVGYLLQEIRREKPAFRSIISKDSIKECFFILPTKQNKRIIKQDGAFIICGLFDILNSGNPINKYRYEDLNRKQIYIIKANSKNSILKELNDFSINKGSLFPEIADVADYIKNNY